MDSNNLKHFKKPTKAGKNGEISTTAEKSIFIIALVIILSILCNYPVFILIGKGNKKNK